jgi:predicted secreted protein
MTTREDHLSARLDEALGQVEYLFNLAEADRAEHRRTKERLTEALAERDEYRVWMRKWRERCMAMSTVEADQRLLRSEGQPVSDIRALTFIECPACGTSVAVAAHHIEP